MTSSATAASPDHSEVRLPLAADSGLTRGRLRSTCWERLSRGLYAPRRPDRPLAELARSVARVLPRGSGFGHLTSAGLRDWWLPNGLRNHVLLATTTSNVHVQRRGLYVRRSRVAEFEDVDGVTCVTAGQTLLELARDLTLVDLVPIVDCALATGTSREEILAAAGRRARGAVTLRAAVRLADPRSESWWESILRLQHVLTGLGPVESQVEIRDEGLLVARADLHLTGTNRYPECDGGEHRDRKRHLKDLRRDKAMQRLGRERYGYSTGEIASQPETVIRDAEDARGLEHDGDRSRQWWRAARTSTVTAYGRTRLSARLERYRLAAERRVAPSGRIQRPGTTATRHSTG